MSKVCPKCGAVNTDAARFCRLCGTAYSPQPTGAPATPSAVPPEEVRTGLDVRHPRVVGAALGAIVLALAAFAGWAYWSSRPVPLPAFDALPPPSALSASMPAPATAAAPTVSPVPAPPEVAEKEDRAPARATAAQPEQARVARRSAKPPAEPANTVQQRCANRPALLQSLCEARACLDRSHAGEPACLRIRAADERRRQIQERGG